MGSHRTLKRRRQRQARKARLEAWRSRPHNPISLQALNVLIEAVYTPEAIRRHFDQQTALLERLTRKR